MNEKEAEGGVRGGGKKEIFWKMHHQNVGSCCRHFEAYLSP